MQARVETHALARSFGTVRAVRDVNLRVDPGEIVGLLGHNGAGKTTTIRLLAGLLKRDGGEVRVFGFDPEVDGVRVRQRIGVSTETPSVDGRLTGREGLVFYAAMHGVARLDVRRRVDELLEEFDLTRAADRRVAGYSKGMRQRLALARALVHDPELLFLDEPTSGLDPIASRHVLERLGAWRAEGRSVVVCTHDLHLAQAICDRVLVLEQGTIVAEGAPSELARELTGTARVTFVTPDADRETVRLVLRKREAWRDVHADAPSPPLGPALEGRVSGVAPNNEEVAETLRVLVQAGVAIHAVERATPTLEDVYVALHQRTEAA